MKRLMLFIVGVVAALTLAVSGCGGDSGGSAAEKLDKAWTTMSETKAVHEEFDIQLEVDGDLSELGTEFEDLLPVSMGMKGSGDVDQSDENNVKLDMELELDIDEFLEKLVTATGSSEDLLSVQMVSGMIKNLKVRMVDQKMYVEVAGTWYEMDPEELSGTSPIDLGLSGTATEDAQCVQDKIKPSELLKDIEDKGSEDIDGAKTTHIQASLDTAKAVDKVVEVAKECSDEEISDSDATEMKDVLEGMVTRADLGVWIDEDSNIRKMTIDVELDMAAAADLAASTLDPQTSVMLEGMTITMNMTLQMSDFGEAVEVEVPEDAVPFEDMLDAFGGLGGGSLGGGTGGLEDFDFGDEGTSTGSSTSTNPFDT